MRSLFIIILLIFPFSIFADTLSAKRSPDVDYMVYFNRALHGTSTYKDGTPLINAKLYKEASLRKVTEWESQDKLIEYFTFLRDLRFIRWNGRDRRSSWLFPDDGCFARASLAVKNLLLNNVKAPDKIFAFGNLKFHTPNSGRGYVTWWYHVAPIVEVHGEKYVLDPSIDPTTPLLLEDWISRMGPLHKLKVSLCSSGTYGPKSNCSKITDGKELAALSAQGKYLNLEWNRLIHLRRNPEKELGDFPPWKNLGTY